MEVVILLLCTYGQTNVVVRLHQGSTFVELINRICRKFDGLIPEMVVLLFAIPEYNKFKVSCDEDVQNMLSIGKCFGLDYIDVIVQSQNVGDGVNCSGDGCMFEDGHSTDGDKMFDVDDRMDLLPLYYKHRS
ncbi:hypothetical protein CsSME_00039015 [Camellia sinensis var. sinensis]